MEKIKMHLIVFAAVAVSSLNVANAQFSVGADVANRYLWRGQLLASGPVVQPYVSYGFQFDTSGVFSLTAGALGSYGIGQGFDGTEADLYLTLTGGPFSLTFTDYYFPSDAQFAVEKDNYFNYKDGETGHVFEGMVSFNGLEKLPLSASLAYNFKGADADKSLFLDLKYTIGNAQLGMSFGDGWYTTETNGKDKFSLINTSVGYTKYIKFSEDYSLPVFGRVAVNPNLEKLYIIFGITL